MFYYYGRKKQIAKHYPLPNYDTIIEPFAGAAAYSMFGDNWKKNVILIEKDEKVFQIWDWLINHATVEEIKRLPNLKVGEKSSEFLHIVHAATKMDSAALLDYQASLNKDQEFCEMMNTHFGFCYYFKNTHDVYIYNDFKSILPELYSTKPFMNQLFWYPDGAIDKRIACLELAIKKTKKKISNKKYREKYKKLK